MNTKFNFKEVGYEAPGDWSRLWDLVPKSTLDATKTQISARSFYEAEGQTKAALLLLLRAYGINPEPYDAERLAVIEWSRRGRPGGVEELKRLADGYGDFLAAER